MLEREKPELAEAILKNAEEAIRIGNVVLRNLSHDSTAHIRFTTNNEGEKKLDAIAEKLETNVEKPEGKEEGEKELRPCFEAIINEKWNLEDESGNILRRYLIGEWMFGCGFSNENIQSQLTNIAGLRGDKTEQSLKGQITWVHQNRKERYACSSIRDAVKNFSKDKFSDLKKVCETCSYNTLSVERKENDDTKPTDILIELAINNSDELIHDQYDDAYVVIKKECGKKCIRLNSWKIKTWLGKLYYTSEKTGVSKETIQTAINTLAGLALYDGKEVFLWNRAAQHNNKIYYEIADEEAHVIEIDEEGWRIVSNPPVLFRDEQHQKAQVMPEKGGDINELWKFITISSERDKKLFISALISYFIPDIDHPVTVLHGQHGSRKTSGSKYTKEFIDPSRASTQRLPKDENNLVLTLFHHWLPAFDNEGQIKAWQSDMLSRAVTGAGEQKRRLYTDEDEVIFDYKRCILINGIIIPISRPDIMDRSILFKLDRRDDNKSEKKLALEFEQRKPFLLGTLFDLLSKTLKVRDEENIEIPGYIRMFDFAEIGEACLQAMGDEPGAFLAHYMESKADDNYEVIESSLMGSVLLDLVKTDKYIDQNDSEISFFNSENKWSGSPSKLLEIFNLKAAELKIDKRSAEWKGSPEGLSRQLTLLKTNFRAAGVEIEFGKSGKRYINILWRAP